MLGGLLPDTLWLLSSCVLFFTGQCQSFLSMYRQMLRHPLSWDRGTRGKAPHPMWDQGAETGAVLLPCILTRVPIIVFSSLLLVMLTMSQLICAMAEDGLLFQGLGQIYARRGTPLVAVLVSAILSGP